MFLPQLASRAGFGRLLSDRGIQVGVEIGVDRGTFARSLMLQWPIGNLFCVDPWGKYPHMPYDRDPDYQMAIHQLAEFGDRIQILRMESAEAAKWLPQYNPGFVYIDGDHGYEAVARDLSIWWDVLKPGGIMAGHDYNAWTGVTEAVNEFISRRNLGPLQTTGDRPASFYLLKR